MDQGSAEKGLMTFAAADHHTSLSQTFSTTNCRDSGIKIGKNQLTC